MNNQDSQTPNLSPHVALLAVQLMFGSAPVLGKAALETFPSFAIVGFRVAGAAFAFFILQNLRGSLRLDKPIHYFYFAVFSCFGVICNQLLFFKGIGQISQEIKEMAARARDKKLQPEEYTGATFSISNLGMFGIEQFTAIINPPEAAIFAIGSAAPKAVVRDGEIVVRNVMNVTMSCDHRVIDGATGAKFLQTFKQMLENPILMLL